MTYCIGQFSDEELSYKLFHLQANFLFNKSTGHVYILQKKKNLLRTCHERHISVYISTASTDWNDYDTNTRMSTEYSR